MTNIKNLTQSNLDVVH